MPHHLWDDTTLCKKDIMVSDDGKGLTAAMGNGTRRETVDATRNSEGVGSGDMGPTKNRTEPGNGDQKI